MPELPPDVRAEAAAAVYELASVDTDDSSTFCHAVVDAVAEVLAVGQQRALTEARRDRDDALAETCEIRAAVGLSAAAPHDELIERLENARHIGDCTEAWRVAEDERDALKARVAELAAAVERNRDA